MTEAHSIAQQTAPRPANGSTIQFPVEVRKSPAVEGQSTSGVAGNVLLVEDDPVIRRSLTVALRAHGYRVEATDQGEVGLEVARELDPDVVLLDVRMPGMNGYEVCRRLKEDPATRLTPVVFLTGEADSESRLEGLDVGASDYLTKPVRLTELLARVRNLVASRRAIQDLDSAQEILFAIARTVEARDEETGDHCERLADLVVRMGRELGLDGDDLTTLRRGAYLHDIGKIGIPDAVLLKPGSLTPDERDVMCRHVAIGVEMCSRLRSLRAVLPIISCHHERLDGSGYPRGLAGDEVPFLARVFQVADVWDALSNDRCYRKAFPADEAVAILRAETDRGWWDPDVVEALARLVTPDPDSRGSRGQ
jgi:putative two-component system response regulator